MYRESSRMSYTVKRAKITFLFYHPYQYTTIDLACIHDERFLSFRQTIIRKNSDMKVSIYIGWIDGRPGRDTTVVWSMKEMKPYSKT